MRPVNNNRFPGFRSLFQRPGEPKDDPDESIGATREADDGDDTARVPFYASVLEKVRKPSFRRPPWLTSASLARQTVTLSVEGSRLQILAVRNGVAEGWTNILVEDRLIRSGQVIDANGLGSLIDDTFDRLTLPRSRVAWALPGHGATFRIVDLPNLRGEELRQAVAEEISRGLGASAEESYLFWQRLTGRIRQRQVFVLVVPKASVLGALEALDTANIQPLTMDLRPLAIARAIGRSDAIVVNLEDDSLDIVIIVDNVPALIRSLPLASAQIGRDAAQNRLVEETERSLGYYDDANLDRPLDVDTPLYLTGSLATGIALAERLRAVTRHPIGRLTSTVAHPPDFPLAEYLVNVGLALKQS